MYLSGQDGPRGYHHGNLRDAIGGDDAAPQQMPHVGCERIDRMLVRVEPERVPAALRQPERRQLLAAGLFTNKIPEDKNNFGPRVGLLPAGHSLESRMVIDGLRGVHPDGHPRNEIARRGFRRGLLAVLAVALLFVGLRDRVTPKVDAADFCAAILVVLLA